MTTDILRRTLTLPRLSLRGMLEYLAALDAAYRERGYLAGLDERALRDVGISRGDMELELRSPLRPLPGPRRR